MNLSGLLDTLREQQQYQDLLSEIQHEHTQGTDLRLSLIRAARPFVLSALAEDTARPILLITSRADRVANLAEQLPAWAPDLHVLTYAEPNALFYEYAPWGPRSTHARLNVLASLIAGTTQPTVIVASARALMQRILPADMLTRQQIIMQAKQRLPEDTPDRLLRRWLGIGYAPVTVVVEPGTFSRRGGILDIYPINATQPVRIELWGDTIESLRAFDPATQRSLHTLEHITISPAREALPELGPQVATALHDWFTQRTETVESDDAQHASLPHDDLEALVMGDSFPTLEFYLPWMVATAASILEYLPAAALIVLDNKADLIDTIADLEQQALMLRDAAEQSQVIPSDMPLPFVPWAHLQDELSQANIIDITTSTTQDSALTDLFTPGPRYAGQLKLFLDNLVEQTRAEHERAVVISRQAARLTELWNERYRTFQPAPQEHILEAPPPGPPIFVQGALTEGWILETGDVTTCVYTDAEIFGWKRPEPRRRPQRRAVAPESFFADLSPGDIVVHAEFGIGRFDGLSKRTFNNIEREFLLLRFAGSDMLYVPIHQADRLSRYVGVNDDDPQLSRLGTPEWARTRQRTRQAVQEIAQELLELYATRETVAGHAFNPDTPWQHELEASFPYVETIDQLRALADVKSDMEKARPMDRLICGDVGYGKTEVALRAAFKAVMDGMQVAILVPTTVLAQQHLETFQQRLAAFPVNVDMLSRFRTKSEQEDTVLKLEMGTADIVIGTHRLLSDDVRFKNLGLLIIDEEQRFGVTHKERLKQFRTEIDVLTLTATPIPRTLYMSLTGARDISIINTAPEERLPVNTHVGKRNDDLIRQAILREIDRGGQVFFVHNRVQTIHTELAKLKQIAPEASYGVAHGQMNESQLEKVMQAFAEGEINVLISTNIIEAGLDIPNANTLIVDRADRFGLSQLYQLRGRVGRSASRAFAYFFHPVFANLTPEARARLETIDEYSDLGAGMNIALRDLEIRGAGDLLGARQSGHIAAVGFHLYTRMLAHTVKRLKEKHDAGLAPDSVVDPLLEPPPREVVTIELPIPTYIPTDYVADLGLRIQLYRRMGDLRLAEDIQLLGEELTDRFGPPPPPVTNLLFQLQVKSLALAAGVEAIVGENGQLSIRVPGLAFANRVRLQERLGHNSRVSRTAVWLPREGDWQTVLVDVLSRLHAELAASVQELNANIT